MNQLTVIEVWASCGKYGWDIPWGRWHAEGVYAYPPHRNDGKYVWIYSMIGQDDQNRYINEYNVQNLPKNDPRLIGMINVDEFLVGYVVDWGKVLREIKKLG